MILKGHKDPNRSVINIIVIFIGLFFIMTGYFIYFLIARSNEVINSSYNKRQELLAERVIRGEIRSMDGDVLARTIVDEEGKESREYPYGDMFAHVVGRVNRGLSGIEEAENIRLLTTNINSIEVMLSDLSGEKSLGDVVVSTLDAGLQQTAYDALGDYRGAVVVLEPSSGKILAMVSKPSYDPNKIDVMWEELVADSETESRLYNRATQGLYPPGSTFKVLTALEYMREHMFYEGFEYDCDGSTEYEGMTIRCYNRKSHGELDLPKALAKSCNTSFATMAKDFDMDRFYELNEDFFFNTSLPIAMASNPSSFTLKTGSSGTKELMQTAIGQGNTLITPLHNALIAASFANGGIMMKPYVVDHVENANGGIVKRYSPQIMARTMEPEEATYIGKMMRLAVTDGTATKLKNLKVEAAGKTGSADHGEGKAAHAWFIGYAPYEDPQIAISVIVEEVGTGSDYAVPIAKKILEAYFKANN